MKVYISRNIPEEGCRLLRDSGFEVIVNTEDHKHTPQELIDACQGVDFLLNPGLTPLDAAFFDACSHLKGVALASVGFDYVDLEAATKHHIPVSHTPDVLSGATADTALLLMLAASRKAFHRSREIAEGKWTTFEYMKDLGQDLDGKTLGIFGLGRIGFEFACKAKAAYDMDVIYYNRSRNAVAERQLGAKYVSFDQLLTDSDVLSVHCNLSPETQYKFNKDVFQRMRKTAIFVNTARGKVHHEADLIDALRTGEIWAAGLDVTDPEPMLPDNPLLRMPNACVLPHIGTATLETRTKMAQMAASNLIITSQGGKMPQIVNKEVYA